jgi:hypothetical protein
MRTRLLTVFVIVSVLSPVAHADDKGRFGLGLSKLNPFRKKEDPAVKPRQLAEVLRTDPDEKKRKAAADDLRDTDPKLVPEVLPVLVASLKQDPSAEVRATVADSIGKLKPVSPNAGVVLEAAAANDPNENVRKAAQNALWAYQANGYRPQNVAASTPTAEPPKAAPRRVPPAAATKQITSAAAPTAAPLGIPTGVNRGPTFGETGEPPLAKSRTAVKPPAPSIPVPSLPAETPRAVPPAGSILTPLPLPPAPSLPQVMPATKPGAAPTIPTPPPSGNPGF